MPTLFHQAFEARAQLAAEKAFGVVVTLKSGPLVTSSFTATYDSHEYESIEFETGLNVKIVVRDYYLPASSLVIGGNTIEPAAGMVVVEGSDEFEIMPLPGRPAAELQPGGWRWVVHTKQTKVA